MKEKDKNQEKSQFEDFLEDVVDQSYVSSAGDCTGLIPSAPSSDAELEAYEQLYHFIQPARDDEKKEES